MRNSHLFRLLVIVVPLAIAEFCPLSVLFFISALVRWDTTNVDPTSLVIHSPDGKVAVSLLEDRRTVRAWRSTNGEELGTIKRNYARMGPGLAFGPDGKTLACSAEDGSITLWDLESREEKPGFAASRCLIPGARKPPFGYRLVEFSPDGNALATVDDDCLNRVRLWDLRQGVELACESPDWLSCDSSNYVSYLAFSSDGKTLAVGNETNLGIWETANGKHLFMCESVYANCLAAAPFVLLIGAGIGAYIRFRRRTETISTWIR